MTITYATHIENDLDGLSTYGTYGSGTNKEKIASLAALISPESTQTHRGFLDQMSTPAHRQLLKELQALEAGITNV